MASYLQGQQPKYVFIQVCILPQSERIRGEWTNGNRFCIIILYLHLYLYVLLMEEPFFQQSSELSWMNRSAQLTTAYTTKTAWPTCQEKKGRIWRIGSEKVLLQFPGHFPFIVRQIQALWKMHLPTKSTFLSCCCPLGLAWRQSEWGRLSVCSVCCLVLQLLGPFHFSPSCTRGNRTVLLYI